MSTPTVAVAPEAFSYAQEHDIRNVHGAPSWMELVTPDPRSAKEVLEKLFGWEIVPLDESETGGAYLVAKVAGHDVGGIREPGPGEPDGPRWISYVTVARRDGEVTEFACRPVLGGLPSPKVVQQVRLTPGHRVDIELSPLPQNRLAHRLAEFRASFECTPVDGGVEVTRTIVFRFAPLVAWFFEPILR